MLELERALALNLFSPWAGGKSLMANPLKILSELTASEGALFNKEVTFNQKITLNNKKIVGLAEGTTAGDAVRYEQLSTEISRATSAEGSLATALGNETATRSLSLSNEQSRAQSSEGSLSTAISNEISRATSAEGSINIAASTAISTEISRAGSAEASLSTALSAEASRAGSAEISVGSSLSVLVSTEASRATSAETSLSTLNANEASRAQSTENSLASQILTETSRASLAETSLSTALSAEASARVATDNSLSTALSAEASRAGSAEASLGLVSSTEASRAASAEASLQVSLSTSISSEVSRATSADNSLSSAISTENWRATSFENSLATAFNAEVSRAVSVESSLATNYLRIDGGSIMSGTLYMGDNNIQNVKTGSFGTITANDITVGNLTVNGGLTYVGTTNLEVTDKQIVIAKGAGTGSNVGTAYDAGVFVGSDTDPVAKMQLNANGLDAGKVEWLLSASAGLSIAATGSDTMVGLGYGAGYDLAIADGKFNVEKGFRSVYKSIEALNNANNNNSNTVDGVAENYAKLRYVEEAALDADGHKEFNLSGSAFTGFKTGTGGLLSALSAVTADVMVKVAGGWTNDLVSVRIEALNTNWVKVIVDAPAHPNGDVRLVAVNETKNDNILLGSLA